MSEPDQPSVPGDGKPPEPPIEIREHMRAAFQSVLDTSVPAYEIGQLKLFHDEEERFIREEVERKLYDPQLPNGGSKERRMIERLTRLARDTEWQGHKRAAYAITQWEKVLPADPRNAGRYYRRKALTPRVDKKEFEWLTDLKDSAHRNKQWDHKWFAEMLLDGLPEIVSDFEMECLFVLRKSDGKVDRLVRLRNILGEVSKGPHHKGSDILDGRAFAAPERFREWCLDHGNFSWKGNQVDLQNLHEDNDHSNAWRVINQIDSVGSLTVGKTVIWFCDECAYASPMLSANATGPTPESQLLLPDNDGVYWLEGEGYYLNRKGRETNFGQGRPRMRPESTTREVLGAGESKLSDRELLRDFYHDINLRLCETLGDHQGSMAMGAILAYSAGPEIFREYGLFPGLFIHGQMESGKTKLTEWLMHVRGFERSSGIGLLKGTPVGLLCEAENYSNEPIWADEYRQGKVSEDKEAVLRDAYNRQPPVKWSADGVQRLMKTSFVVSGESTSSDSATRSRFPHIQVSAAKRKANHLVWMEANKSKFFVIGRFVHEHRNEFVSHLRRFLNIWLQLPDLAGVNERERMVHGIDYASWMAMCQMLESHGPSETSAFTSFMLNHAKGSAADVTSETNIMVFLGDLLTAWKAEAIPQSCFRVESTFMEFPPGCPNQKSRWDSYRIFIDPDPTISAIRSFLAKQRCEITLRRKDLRDQLSKTPFWIEAPKGKKLRKRFGKGGGGTPAWGFALDLMGELGYQPCTDEEWNEFLLSPDQGDPRKGPFYTIIDEIMAEERKIAREAR